jgi:hypothetical protein
MMRTAGALSKLRNTLHRLLIDLKPYVRSICPEIVRSYEDLDKARAARAAKEKAAADNGKGNRGLKRKISAREAEGDVEGDADGQEAGSSVPTSRDKRAKRSNLEEPEPWRAPVALMYK